MEKTIKDYQQISGWGIDADPENDPTYPMQHREKAPPRTYPGERATQQESSVEVLRSNERPNNSAVFGTTVPPSGLSGMIRRFAFRYSENEYRHWLPLLVADRVNVVEGLVSDLAHGKVPNIFAEKGYAVDWKHNRPALVAKLGTVAAIAAGVTAYLVLSKGKSLKGGAAGSYASNSKRSRA